MELQIVEVVVVDHLVVREYQVAPVVPVSSSSAT
jgi:hypothetical protein